MADLTEQQRHTLQTAVDRLNVAMELIRKTGGESVRVRPWASYDADSGIAYVRVEVTTGRVVIKTPDFPGGG